MVDIHTETLLSFKGAANCLPGRIAVSTIWRWAQKGVRGVKLETYMVGGRRFTSREALDRFCESITAIANGCAPTIRTPKQRELAIVKAEAELTAAGI